MHGLFIYDIGCMNVNDDNVQETCVSLECVSMHVLGLGRVRGGRLCVRVYTWVL